MRIQRHGARMAGLRPIADVSVEDDREAADQDEADAFPVEGSAEGEEVFELRRA